MATDAAVSWALVNPEPDRHPADFSSLVLPLGCNRHVTRRSTPRDLQNILRSYPALKKGRLISGKPVACRARRRRRARARAPGPGPAPARPRRRPSSSVFRVIPMKRGKLSIICLLHPSSLPNPQSSTDDDEHERARQVKSHNAKALQIRPICFL